MSTVTYQCEPDLSPEDFIDVLVRSQEADRSSLDDIKRLIVNPESSAPVTLDSVAEVVATTGPRTATPEASRRFEKAVTCGAWCATTVQVKAVGVVERPSVTETVTLYTPAVVGVPVMRPVTGSMLSPGGRSVALYESVVWPA